MSFILKCKICNSYGLTKKCSCGHIREQVKPAKFSPDDKYARYRRQYKKDLGSNNL